MFFYCWGHVTQVHAGICMFWWQIRLKVCSKYIQIYRKCFLLPFKSRYTYWCLFVCEKLEAGHCNSLLGFEVSPSPSKFTARNLEVAIDAMLNFSDHIVKTVRSCRFALFNIRKIRPFLSEHATQLFVQALVLSRLDYCSALLAGLPASSIKPLQLIYCIITHVTPIFINLYWIPIAARIKFKALMFAYKTTTGSAPLYLNLLPQTYVPSRSLRSASERRFIVPS